MSKGIIKASSRLKDVGRRGFIGAAGASALTASSAIFGTVSTAYAGNYACCNLAFAPNGNYSGCLAGSHYVWYCQWSPTMGCGCCEFKNGSGQYYASAYYCERV